MSDRLLYTLSTRGVVRLERFHELLEDTAVSASAGTAPNSSFDLRREVARLLDALGHCEFDYEKRQVWACPPSLIILPASGLAQAVLSGARTPALLNDLKQAVRQKNREAAIQITKLNYENVSLPAVVTVSAVSIDALKDIAAKAGIRWPSDQAGAIRLGAFSASIGDIASNLIFTERANINWPRKIFSVQELSFARNMTEPDYKLICYTSPIDQQLQHWLWDGTKAATVERDWGRFLALAHHNKQVMFYDSRKHRLCLPTTTWLPALLARALTLCSGQVPSRYRLESDHFGISSNQTFHVYAGVPSHVATLVGSKVGQTIIDARCDENEAQITPC